MQVMEESVLTYQDPTSPDVDRMTYEQLLEMGDSAGSVSKGLSLAQINKIKAIMYVEGNSDTDACTICMEKYTTGTKLKKLPCKHEYHSECVNEWLAASKKCPVCAQDVLL